MLLIRMGSRHTKLKMHSMFIYAGDCANTNRHHFVHKYTEYVARGLQAMMVT